MVNPLRLLPAFRKLESDLESCRGTLARLQRRLLELQAERDEFHAHALRLDRERVEGLKREELMTAELADSADLASRLYEQRDALERERDELKTYLEPLERLKSELAVREQRMIRAETELSRLRGLLWAPPGHFYSPLVDPSDPHAALASTGDLRALEGRPDLVIDEPGMLSLLERIAAFYPEMPWQPARAAGARYFFDNPHFGEGDAITLYGLLRLFKPRRFMEVGCGYSSLASMDVNDFFLGGTMDTLYIDPNPEQLEKLLDDADPYRARIRATALQDVPLDWFTELEAGDVLFIDSSHVLKTGSDVCDALFRILPALASGVVVHFHDILYPFEYPREWICQENRSWNETYALRAFLQYNSAFRVLFFNNLIYRKYPDLTERLTPLCARNAGGGLWLRKN